MIYIDFELLELLSFAEGFAYAFVLVFHFGLHWLCFQSLQLTHNLVGDLRLCRRINLPTKYDHRALRHLRFFLKIYNSTFQLLAGAISTWVIILSTSILVQVLFIQQVNITLTLVILIQLFIILFNFIFSILVILIKHFLLLLFVYTYLRINASCM